MDEKTNHQFTTIDLWPPIGYDYGHESIHFVIDPCYVQQVFENLRRDQPQVMDKVIPVAGDVTLPGLGISPQDLKLICEDVSIVFNSAATVRFDEDLKTAVELNVKGPQRLMQVCHQMKRLEVLLVYFLNNYIT